MKKIYLMILLSLFSVITLTSCCMDINLSGVKKTQQLQLRGFDKIDVHGFIELNINIADQDNITVVADSVLFPYIEIKQEGDELKIRLKEEIRFIHRDIVKINITTPSLQELNISGACSTFVNNLTAERFGLEISGASKFIANMDCDYVNIDVSGASKLDLRGKANGCKIDISGASKVDALDLEVNDLSLDISGASKIDVNVLENIKANISGTSVLGYKGNPKTKSINVTGISVVKQL